MTTDPQSADAKSREATAGTGTGVMFLLFGLYLLFGAFEAFRTAKWPIFMPPQLDLVALLLSIFGAPAGAYLAGGIVALLGAGCAYLGVRVAAKSGHA